MPASMQRARMLAWEMGVMGWDVEILSPSADFQQKVWVEPFASHFFNSEIRRHEAKPLLVDRLFKALGMKSAAWRGLFPMYWLGSKLLAKGEYDIVYFSTTTFTFFCLGRLWRWRYKRPYILDYQDPWYNPSFDIKSKQGTFKNWLSNKLAKYLEAFSIRGASGVISVSPGYLKTLVGRYGNIPALLENHKTVIPFGALKRDLAFTSSTEPTITVESDIRTIAYVGVGDFIMQRSFRRIVLSLARLRLSRPELVNPVRLLLRGTQGGWRAGERKVLWEEANLAGVGDIVIEDPSIVSYSAAISQALAADGLLVLGVDDSDYMPSKLFTYAFTGKPLLACLHHKSQANDYFATFPDLGTLIHFGGSDRSHEAEDKQLIAFLHDLMCRRHFERSGVEHQYSAASMAAQHAGHFERCLQHAL